ncbi:Heterokaryon incompatibility protein 6, OR allele [Fulvia fulva]|uniref:Heterokaryon incompatibility protein 6, OR allele n=1 Tax=Passalora fulva TaxID=5499 RepID=A0A9Q8P997_PASFU|nr:Heterokaryon incompatibility protein 6, OR allele [Fulvia fulva]KAK4624415.1 Heterokaryon incompatibility protein 6, OR allele [Fulvia fulva]KAK4625449.1 Heterokaryon incompatibility protein 6, OR allele [Fulvia fulva]UJO18060.1 Heterokaryon incompatibility protein 6, OR allele [Fulvia fulva]WPV15091.1 Heterokaryon incompatibility protein 6, OR allele [Fulvia fulva]WPV30594.1 Heterokaryon incompatibility protein 6, OR allele [Fulvia fulva]
MAERTLLAAPSPVSGDGNVSKVKTNSPHHMGDYQYEPLRETSIRLVTFVPVDELSLSMKHFDDWADLRRRETWYTALSYCWGSSERSSCINVNGSRLAVTENLMTVLALIRAHHLPCHQKPLSTPRQHREWFWIDQICINQDDVDERNEQVQDMWRIYSSARRVFALLGVTAPDVPELFPSGCATSRDIEDSVNAQLRNPSEQWEHNLTDPDWDRTVSPHRLSTAEYILGVPYFKRTWIVPELLQARSLHFICGAWSLPAAVFRDLLRLLRISSSLEGSVSELGRISRLLEDSRDLQVRSAQQRVRVPSACIAFLDNLRSLHDTVCSDGRDKIFAALSCPGSKSLSKATALKPDYSATIDELAVLVVAYVDQLLNQNETEWPQGPRDDLARTLARSLGMCDERHTTMQCHLAVASAILACTRPWRKGEPLLMTSGRQVISPGPYLTFYLTSVIRDPEPQTGSQVVDLDLSDV